MKYVYVCLGFIALFFGVLGIFLPVLPTTPFLLLAAWLYFHSSSKLYTWLLQHKYLGTYIRHFREYRAIPLHAKVISMLLLWTTVLYSVSCIIPWMWVNIGLVVVAIGVSWYILSLRTL